MPQVHESYYDKLNHMLALKEEVKHLKTMLRPHDTGHIHTTISTLQNRVEEIRNGLADNGETKW